MTEDDSCIPANNDLLYRGSGTIYYLLSFMALWSSITFLDFLAGSGRHEVRGYIAAEVNPTLGKL